MSISSTTRKAGPYAGNNVTAAFPFKFKVFSDADLIVIDTDPNGVETTLALSTDYTVALNADQNASPGGTVTLAAGALATGYLLTITSAVSALQPADLTNQGGFYPSVINDALDRLTILAQQVAEQVGRAVKVNISSSTDPAALVNQIIADAASAAASAADAANSATAAANAVPSGSLTYTPVDKAGDTMTGNLAVPGINVGGSGVVTSLGNAATKTTGQAIGNVPLVEDIPTLAIPAGAVMHFAMSTAPSGWLKANGALISRTTYAALFAALVKSSTVTISIATPGVVTWAAHGRSANDPVKFTTTGALPTGLTAGTTYYVVGASITTNTFQVSATAGGAAINTSGSQSGVQTAIHAPFGDGDGSTTFTLPDLRGEFLRGWDDSRAVDSNRAFGSAQAQDVQPHAHSMPWRASGSLYGGTGSSFTAIENSPGGSTNNSTGTETRPRNVAALACIKY